MKTQTKWQNPIRFLTLVRFLKTTTGVPCNTLVQILQITSEQINSMRSEVLRELFLGFWKMTFFMSLLMSTSGSLYKKTGCQPTGLFVSLLWPLAMWRYSLLFVSADQVRSQTQLVKQKEPEDNAGVIKRHVGFTERSLLWRPQESRLMFDLLDKLAGTRDTDEEGVRAGGDLT